MNFSIKALALLVLVQIILIAGINFANNTQGDTTTKPLIEQSLADIRLLQLKNNEQSVRLEKQNGQWLMPEYGQMPVTQGKVDQLLEKLATINVSWPTATSNDAAERFEVAAHNAQKTVSFGSSDSDLTHLYLGTSPSYRKIHTRLDGHNAIYVAELAQHDAPALPENWLDKTLLSVTGDITSVTTEHFSLTRSGPTNIDDSNAANDGNSNEAQWQLSSTENTPDTVIDNALAQQWVNRFNNLLVSKLIVDQDQVQSIVIQNPVATMHLIADGKPVDYAFYTHNEQYFVKQFGDTPVFEIANYQADPIINVAIENFAVTATAESSTQRKTN